MGFQILHFNRVTSTQDIAKMILKENVVIVADEQTSARGRYGRSWISPYGGLWLTVILKDRKENIITLAAGVAVVKALKNMGVDAKIKWPNDILVHGKKAAGILAEIYGDYLLLGIGINLENEIPEEIKEIATNLPHIEKEALLPLLLEILEEEIEKDKERIIEEWRNYQCTLGRRVLIDEKIEGIAESIDDEGFLILNCNGKRERILAGTLRFLDGQKY